jgi:uncharacterized protein YggE
MRNRTLVLFVLCCLSPALTRAQAAGLRGAEQEKPQIQRIGPPADAAATQFIVVEAVAEVRVAPTQLRLVFSVSATGETTSAASIASSRVVEATKQRLLTAGVPIADIDVDFIAAVPVYGWSIEDQKGRKVLVERRQATRVQNNLHVVVADEAKARIAIEAATAGDGVDLLAVDYWSQDLEAKQAEALQKAVAKAQAKAKTLLAVFPEPPRPINVHENTAILFPQQLYQNLPRAEDSGSTSWFDRELAQIAATRPLLVYYRGLFADVDALDPRMPGAREIEVVSTVRLYFEAPHRTK